MKEFYSNTQVKSMHKAIRQYLHMVGVIRLNVRFVRTSNWALHLSALEEFVKYLFALDTFNYARMIPIYI